MVTLSLLADPLPSTMKSTRGLVWTKTKAASWLPRQTDESVEAASDKIFTKRRVAYFNHELLRPSSPTPNRLQQRRLCGLPEGLQGWGRLFAEFT